MTVGLAPARSTPLVARSTAQPAPLEVLAAWGRPAALVRVRGWDVVVGAPLARIRDLDALDVAAGACGWRTPAAAGPPFSGGLVGAVSDDLSTALLGLPTDPRPPTALPALDFGVYDTAACRAPDGVWHLVAADLAPSTRLAAERLAELERVVADAGRLRSAPPPAWQRAAGSLERRDHGDAVATALRWITAGDLYQLNLTLQLRVGWDGDGLSLGRRLLPLEPQAAHGALLLGDGSEQHDVVSVSPETFLRTCGDEVRMRPIKGTRARGAGAEDQRQARALLASAKDRAEHVMIVDLVRNDLGRVCRTGSVRVAQLTALERLPTVWHLTSEVVGQLGGDVTLSDLLRATFPAGSVTGAPKRMAAARIRALEPVRRGVYCGAVGVVSRGLVELSVAIRTAVVAGGVAAYGTGGGIVADSQPAAEWDEAMAKARAFLRATNAAPPR